MISFIIPAHNEQSCIEAAVQSVITSAQAVGCEHEVIVVADACTDDTTSLAEAAGARVVAVDHRQIAATRNSGAAAAVGDQLIFMDADTLLNTDLLRAAVGALNRGVVGGGAGVRFDGSVGVLASMFVFNWNLFARILRWAAGCFIFVQREDFQAVGGFNEQYFAAEELFLSTALKRRGPFVILRQRIETSGRKMHMYPVRKWLPHVIRLMLSGPNAYRNRDKLWMWYDGKRQ